MTTAGSGGQSPTTPVLEPIDRGGGVYALEFDGLYFETVATVAGRITQFNLDGVEVLVPATAVTGSVANMYGSTFWTSPQADWDWPPPEAMDPGAYTATVEGSSITMNSGAIAIGTGQVQIVKRFTPDLARRAIIVEYFIYNQGAVALNVAPWEISRVALGGLTFFPTGQAVVSSGLTLQDDAAGISWYDGSASPPANDGKFIGDGAEGWLAHAAGQLLFLRSFQDLSPEQAAPGEGEIEIYASTPNAYVEVEPQGPYQSVAPATMTPAWVVTWKLRRIPDDVSVAVGSTALVEFARAVAAE